MSTFCNAIMHRLTEGTLSTFAAIIYLSEHFRGERRFDGGRH